MFLKKSKSNRSLFDFNVLLEEFKGNNCDTIFGHYVTCLVLNSLSVTAKSSRLPNSFLMPSLALHCNKITRVSVVG